VNQPEPTVVHIDHTRPFLEIIKERAQRFHPYPQRLVELFETVPRAFFVPDELQEFLEQVETDEGCGGLLSQPGVIFSMVAYLFLKGTEQVLEGGTGTGYQTALLARLAKHVVTVEVDRERMGAAKARLDSLGITNVTFIHGDAAYGAPQFAPFNRMIFGAAIHGETIDRHLVDQMAPKSRLLVPTGKYDDGRRTVVGDLLQCDKNADGRIVQKMYPVYGGTLSFVPLISARSIGWTVLKGTCVPSTPLARIRRKVDWELKRFEQKP
jgi:protein-L-isoaspartate(D-aspartate) O-methyltransferase